MESSEVISQLKNALALIMNPLSDQKARVEAYQFCEEFKNQSPNCAEVGIHLSMKENNEIVRHFGLQLLEHCVKFRWNGMSLTEKKNIKESSMTLIKLGTLDILSEQKHIKDGLSRIIVEIAKREWPQQWLSMISEFDALCTIGPTQTELILLIFLRLAEDVLMFQTTPAQRRRDIQQAFISIISQLFSFLYLTLFNQYNNIASQKGNNNQSTMTTTTTTTTNNNNNSDTTTTTTTTTNNNNSNITPSISTSVIIISVSCEVINTFIDLISIHLLVTDKARLIYLLLDMLTEPLVQMFVADSLLEIAGKKGKSEERVPLIEILMSSGSLDKLKSVAISTANEASDEKTFKFFKKLCQVLVTIGTQMCSILTYPVISFKLVNLESYMNIILSFTVHPSQVISGFCLPLWCSMLRCQRITDQACTKQCVESLVVCTLDMLNKVGRPSQNNHPSCVYSKFDFDFDDEFQPYFSRYRSDLGEVIRCCTTCSPNFAFRFAANRLQQLLNKTVCCGELDPMMASLPQPLLPLQPPQPLLPLQPQPPQPPPPQSSSSSSSYQPPSAALNQLFLEWESIVMCLENVVEKIDFLDFDEDLTASAIKLYSDVLDFQCPDATISSFALSVISSLLPLVNKENSLLTKVVEKLFSCMVFNFPGQTKSTRSKLARNVRRHACSAFIKICKTYTKLLLPGFDLFYKNIKLMSVDEMSQMEKCTCYEALIIIHNMKKNFNEQVQFLKEITQPVVEYWMSESLARTMWSVDNFMDFIGITRPPVEPSTDDVSGINRSQIQYCLALILSVIKRCEFVVEGMEEESCAHDYSSDPTSPLFKCPSTEIVIPLYHNVFGAIRCYHEMFHPQNFSKVYPDFVASFQLSEGEKLSISGVSKATLGNQHHGNQQQHQHQHHHSNGNSSNPYSYDATASSKDPIERMLTFFNNLSDFCYNIIGNSFKHIGYSFYSLPNLREHIINNVLFNIFMLPEHRIKQILYFILKPLVLNCPKEHYGSIVIPVVQALCPSFYQYLTTRWSVVITRYTQDTMDNNTEERSDYVEREELVEEQMIKLITREYLDFIDCLFRDKKFRSLSGSGSHQQSSSSTTSSSSSSSHSNHNTGGGGGGGGGGGDGEEMMEDGEAMMMMMNQRKNKEEVFGELGELVMASDDTSASLILLLFVSLSWQDTSSCNKSITWCYPVLKKLVSMERMSPEYARDFFQSLLIGLNVHGQHDVMLYSIIASLVQTYELLVPRFPCVRDVLLTIPGCTEENLKAFDNRLVSSSAQQQRNFEKKKRDLFKNLVDGAIGQNIGQRYKNPIQIKNLKPFNVFRQKQRELLEQKEAHDLGLCELFAGEKY